jgi:hypothetical protein
MKLNKIINILILKQKAKSVRFMWFLLKTRNQVHIILLNFILIQLKIIY